MHMRLPDKLQVFLGKDRRDWQEDELVGPVGKWLLEQVPTSQHDSIKKALSKVCLYLRKYQEHLQKRIQDNPDTARQNGNEATLFSSDVDSFESIVLAILAVIHYEKQPKKNQSWNQQREKALAFMAIFGRRVETKRSGDDFFAFRRDVVVSLSPEYAQLAEAESFAEFLPLAESEGDFHVLRLPISSEDFSTKQKNYFQEKGLDIYPMLGYSDEHLRFIMVTEDCTPETLEHEKNHIRYPGLDHNGMGIVLNEVCTEILGHFPNAANMTAQEIAALWPWSEQKIGYEKVVAIYLESLTAQGLLPSILRRYKEKNRENSEAMLAHFLKQKGMEITFLFFLDHFDQKREGDHFIHAWF